MPIFAGPKSQANPFNAPGSPWAHLGYPLRYMPASGPPGQPLDAFQYADTASGSMSFIYRQDARTSPTQHRLQKWPGNISQVGRQWQPKIRGLNSLKNRGFRATWDTLTLSPLYIPSARVQQRQSMRYTGNRNFRPAGSRNIPAVFVPSAARSFVGGFGNP